MAKLREKAIHLGLDLQGGMHLVLEVDRSKLAADEAEGAVDRAIEVIRNRIDQFGVAEPLIQKQGEDRIVVQLPGLTDAQRAKDLIGKTALLEFKLVRSPRRRRPCSTRLDALPGRGARRGAGAGRHRRWRHAAHLALPRRPGAAPRSSRDEDVPSGAASCSPRPAPIRCSRATRSCCGATEERLRRPHGRWLYVLKREPEMTGGSVASADRPDLDDRRTPAPGGEHAADAAGPPSDFARVTGANVGRQLAIVLDSVVCSAPRIRERIPGGDARITGSFDVEEAKDLAIVLRAGALPAPVTIIEERTVGPSLGQDSIRDGLNGGAHRHRCWSIAVHARLLPGCRALIAIAALVLNILYLFAGLAGFGATLTLPGIAGIVLTIGMAVDANVLIFERIREELRERQERARGGRAGLRPRLPHHPRRQRHHADLGRRSCSSSAPGRSRASPSRWSVGLIANMFTAVLFTRMIFDFIAAPAAGLNRLSI